MDSAISIRGLRKNYGNFALKDIDLEVPKGSIVGFIGDNGAGKTTTIKAILNLINRDAGEISVFGSDNIKEERAVKRQLGMVFDECCFHETLRAGDVAKILGNIYGEWDDQSFAGYLRRLCVPDNQSIKEFSSGMRMKLSLAAALSHNARLLLLDEATSGLDPIIRSEVLDIFMEFMQDEERAILLSSHITSDLEKICDYIYFIHDGEIVLTDSKDALLEEYGVLRCGERQLESLVGELAPLRKRRSAFGCDLLLRDRAEALRRHPDAVVDRPTLEEIMLFLAKGESM